MLRSLKERKRTEKNGTFRMEKNAVPNPGFVMLRVLKFLNVDIFGEDLENFGIVHPSKVRFFWVYKNLIYAS